MSERPSSPLDTVMNNAVNIEQLMHKQNEMEKLMSQMLEAMSNLQNNQQAIAKEVPVVTRKDAKMPDVREFTGNHREFSQFEILLESYFRNQPSRFANDFSKIDYVGTRLTGDALEWYTSFKLRERQKKSALSDSYTLFWDYFSKSFKDHNESKVAKSGCFFFFLE